MFQIRLFPGKHYKYYKLVFISQPPSLQEKKMDDKNFLQLNSDKTDAVG